MESQVPSDHEASTQPEDVFIKDVITSETNLIASNKPVKKQTRNWAAWTRQEEESFFTALRQVGKNFEKITSRVESKNKDQVRHYYYRLVRRMNKLLGPELLLDAKNQKETNAAMLRWWSLLEKHCCKASKLHLKPRRFKIFRETLENQILKDRKKNMRKRPKQGGNSSTTTIKPSTQRRRSGTASTEAYKKWEKAAIAGVSLVADAAEHLERTTLDKLADSVQDLHGDNGSDAVAKSIPPVPDFHQNTKLKLQLFPVDESTRRALEMDNHNPHLELTLSTRKKISSVLEHMTRKWGKSSIASGELTLVPYCDQTPSTSNSHKWTRDSVLSAGDVYAAIGSPSVFRLRYGWFAKAISTLEWDDGVTNISVGDLLSELSQKSDANHVGPPLPPGSPFHRQMSFSCDSFDAAIAAHITKHNGKNTFQPVIASSIWDAEETCDAFSFPKNLQSIEENVVKDDPRAEVHLVDECRFDDNHGHGSAKDVGSLTDIYWVSPQGGRIASIELPWIAYLSAYLLIFKQPDSLGPFDLDMQSCRYTDDVIMSDSLGGLNFLINSSLDAFENCSFFGSENRETPLTVGAQEPASSSDNKTNSKI